MHQRGEQQWQREQRLKRTLRLRPHLCRQAQRFQHVYVCCVASRALFFSTGTRVYAVFLSRSFVTFRYFCATARRTTMARRDTVKTHISPQAALLSTGIMVSECFCVLRFCVHAFLSTGTTVSTFLRLLRCVAHADFFYDFCLGRTASPLLHRQNKNAHLRLKTREIKHFFTNQASIFCTEKAAFNFRYRRGSCTKLLKTIAPVVGNRRSAKLPVLKT